MDERRLENFIAVRRKALGMTQVVRQTVDYSRARKKKTKGQKLDILLLIVVLVYLGCFTYDNFVPGTHYFAGRPEAVYETDGSVSDKVNVIFHGKRKNCLLPFYMDDFVGTVGLKLPEMKTGEQVYIWLNWMNETPEKTTGDWLPVTSGGMADELLSTMEEEVVFSKDMKEFAFAFKDGRIAATSEDRYNQLKKEPELAKSAQE